MSTWRSVTFTGCKQVIETLRAALEALAVVAPAWLGGLVSRDWARRYGQRGDDWRLPTSEQARVERAVAVGRDGYLLLEAVYAPDAPMGWPAWRRCRSCGRPGSGPAPVSRTLPI